MRDYIDKLDKELKDFDYIVSEANKHKEAGLELKNKAGASERDLQKAANEFKKAIELMPETHPDSRKLQGLMSETKKALIALRAKNVDGNAVRKTYKDGLIYWDKGKRTEAKEEFQKCLELDPDLTLDETIKAAYYLKQLF